MKEKTPQKSRVSYILCIVIWNLKVGSSFNIEEWQTLHHILLKLWLVES